MSSLSRADIATGSLAIHRFKSISRVRFYVKSQRANSRHRDKRGLPITNHFIYNPI